MCQEDKATKIIWKNVSQRKKDNVIKNFYFCCV